MNKIITLIFIALTALPSLGREVVMYADADGILAFQFVAISDIDFGNGQVQCYAPHKPHEGDCGTPHLLTTCNATPGRLYVSAYGAYPMSGKVILTINGKGDGDVKFENVRFWDWGGERSVEVWAE